MVTLRIEVDEQTAERLRERAIRAGLTVEVLAAETLREQAQAEPSAAADEARQAKALKYGLDTDDPLLDLIGLIGPSSTDALTASRQALVEFYASHLDHPR